MNKKYRLFGKIPVVDILILLALLAVTAAGIYLLTRPKVKTQTGTQSQVKTYPFTATFLLPQVRQDNLELLQIGDELYTDKGGKIGEVTALERKPYKTVRYDGDGKEVNTLMPQYSVLYVTVKGEATASSNRGTFVGKRRIALNNNMLLVSQKINWTAQVVALEVAS